MSRLQQRFESGEGITVENLPVITPFDEFSGINNELMTLSGTIGALRKNGRLSPTEMVLADKAQTGSWQLAIALPAIESAEPAIPSVAA